MKLLIGCITNTNAGNFSETRRESNLRLPEQTSIPTTNSGNAHIEQTSHNSGNKSLTKKPNNSYSTYSIKHKSYWTVFNTKRRSLQNRKWQYWQQCPWHEVCCGKFPLCKKWHQFLTGYKRMCQNDGIAFWQNHKEISNHQNCSLLS